MCLGDSVFLVVYLGQLFGINFSIAINGSGDEVVYRKWPRGKMRSWVLEINKRKYIFQYLHKIHVIFLKFLDLTTIRVSKNKHFLFDYFSGYVNWVLFTVIMGK